MVTLPYGLYGKKVFEGSLEPPTRTCKRIWGEIIHTLRGQFEAIQVESEKFGKITPQLPQELDERSLLLGP